MILDYVIFGSALVGSMVAAAYDLKTTEVPNWVFYAMMIVGIPAVILKSILGGDFGIFAISGITGLALFGLGYLMYRTGQWGGADMTLLGLIGFLIPAVGLSFPAEPVFPFGASFVFNLFLIGAGYMIIYAIIFSIRNKVVIRKFKSSIFSSSKFLTMLSASMLVVFTAFMLYINHLIGGSLDILDMLYGIFLPFALSISIFFLYKFAKCVEVFGFKKKISVSRLRIGDMLLDEKKLVGITVKQITKIRRSGKKHVWIKDGVRFVPAFPAALLFTLYVGDAILLLRLFF